MTKADLSGATWYKSSYSNHRAECVEIAAVAGSIATRDSKNPSGPALLFPATEWAAFVSGLNRGALGAR
jgi:hypothetical protein